MTLHAKYWRVPCACLALLGGVPAMADNEVETLRKELQAVKTQYESRIKMLEQRLEAVESRSEAGEATATAAPAPVTAPEYGASTGDYSRGTYAGASNQYNPAIGVILQGRLTSYDENPDEFAIPGFPAGGESGLADEGLSIGESELVFTSNVDDWFYAQVTASIEQEDGEFNLSLEEAFLDTLTMPWDTTVRFGRFYSAVGYLNDKHSHTWDFVDQAMPYAAMLGNQYGDDGIQWRWLVPTDLFLEVGAEMFSGGNYPAAGNARDGFGTYSMFVHAGGDIGFSNSWSAGLSWLRGKARERDSGGADAALSFNGDTDIYIADALWKWAPNGNVRERNFKLQAEYLWRNENGDYNLPGANGSTPIDADSSGWYVQAIYQWRPRWRAGVRFDGLDQDNPGSAYRGSVLAPEGDDPLRYSLMLDYSNSEFSRLRLQYNRDESGYRHDNQFIMQYIMSIGAHGAHEF